MRLRDCLMQRQRAHANAYFASIGHLSNLNGCRPNDIFSTAANIFMAHHLLHVDLHGVRGRHVDCADF
jgi:hypothetical protein